MLFFPYHLVLEFPDVRLRNLDSEVSGGVRNFRTYGTLVPRLISLPEPPFFTPRRMPSLFSFVRRNAALFKSSRKSGYKVVVLPESFQLAFRKFRSEFIVDKGRYFCKRISFVVCKNKFPDFCRKEFGFSFRTASHRSAF